MTEIILNNVLPNPSLTNMKDPATHESKLTHLNKNLLSFTKKSTHFGVKLIKGVVPDNLSAIQKFTKLWKSNRSSNSDEQTEGNGTAVRTEQKSKSGQELKTKNIKVITREDILSNRYDLDLYYNTAPSSPISDIPDRSNTFTSLTSNRKKKSTSLKRSSSYQPPARRSMETSASIPCLSQSQRSSSAIQLSRSGREFISPTSSPSYTHLPLHKSVKFDVKEENDDGKEIQQQGIPYDSMLYTLKEVQDDPGAVYLNSLVKSLTRESQISDSHSMYL